MTRKRAGRREGAKSKAARRGKARKRDPLDDFIDAATRTLDLTIEPAWRPAIKTYLQSALALGSFVGEFALPDEIEPAPVFRA